MSMTNNGLVLPRYRGDESDDVNNWPVVDKMITGTHDTVRIRSNKNPGPGIGGRSRCATRLYSTALNNTTSLALAGYGFPSADTKITHALLAETEVDFDAVSLIVQNTTASALTWSNVKASSVRQVGTANANITETISATFAGASSISVPAGSTSNPTLVVSDPIPLNSVARTDSGVRPLLMLTAETATAVDGSTQIGSWYRETGDDTTKTHSGGRVFAAMTLAGSVAPADIPMNDAGTGTSSAIIGFVYWSRGAKVLTVLEAGNSIVAGSSLVSVNRGHLVRAVEEMSTKSAPVEYMVVGLLGQGIDAIRSLTDKILSQGSVVSGLIPGVVVFNPFDTNANIGGAIAVGPMRAATGRLASRAQAVAAELVLMQGLPRQSNSTTSAWSNDVVRRQFNSTMADDYLADVVPQAEALQSASNPELFDSASVINDFTHPNDVGDNVIKSLLKKTLAKYA